MKLDKTRITDRSTTHRRRCVVAFLTAGVLAAAAGTASGSTLSLTATAPSVLSTTSVTITNPVTLTEPVTSPLSSTPSSSGSEPVGATSSRAASGPLSIKAKDTQHPMTVPSIMNGTVPGVYVPTPPAPIIYNQTAGTFPCTEPVGDGGGGGSGPPAGASAGCYLNYELVQAQGDVTEVEANVNQYYNYLVQVLDSTSVGGCIATNLLTSCLPDFPEVDGALVTVETDAQAVISDLTTEGYGTLGTAESALNQAIQTASGELNAAVAAVDGEVGTAGSQVLAALAASRGYASDAIAYAEGLAGQAFPCAVPQPADCVTETLGEAETDLSYFDPHLVGERSDRSARE